MTFSHRLKKLRERNGLSQTEAETRCGLSHSWWSQLECEARLPSFRTFVKICQQFPASADWLLGLSPALEDGELVGLLHDLHEFYGKEGDEWGDERDLMDRLREALAKHKAGKPNQ